MNKFHTKHEFVCAERFKGGNCIVIEKCSEATRLKLKILDSDPSYVVSDDTVWHKFST